MIDEFKEKKFCVRKRFKQNFKVLIFFKLWGQIILIHLNGKVLNFSIPSWPCLVESLEIIRKIVKA